MPASGYHRLGIIKARINVKSLAAEAVMLREEASRIDARTAVVLRHIVCTSKAEMWKPEKRRRAISSLRWEALAMKQNLHDQQEVKSSNIVRLLELEGVNFGIRRNADSFDVGCNVPRT